MLHALAGRSSVQAVCNGPSMSAVQSTTVYMADGCMIHISDIVHRQHLRSAGCHQLFVPRHRHSIMFGRRAFSVAGPAAWNSLPDYLRDPSRSFDSFRRDLKSFLVLLEACDYAL